MGESPRNLGYARKACTNNKDSVTWVPRSSHGMTEFFYKNSVYIYLAKLLFIKVIEFLFRLFYNPCEPTGMLGQGRKKSLIVAVFFGTLISDYGKIKNQGADALFILQKFARFLSGGPWLYNSAFA